MDFYSKTSHNLRELQGLYCEQHVKGAGTASVCDCSSVVPHVPSEKEILSKIPLVTSSAYHDENSCEEPADTVILSICRFSLFQSSGWIQGNRSFEVHKPITGGAQTRSAGTGGWQDGLVFRGDSKTEVFLGSIELVDESTECLWYCDFQRDMMKS